MPLDPQLAAMIAALVGGFVQVIKPLVKRLVPDDSVNTPLIRLLVLALAVGLLALHDHYLAYFNLLLGAAGVSGLAVAGYTVVQHGGASTTPVPAPAPQPVPDTAPDGHGADPMVAPPAAIMTPSLVTTPPAAGFAPIPDTAVHATGN